MGLRLALRDRRFPEVSNFRVRDPQPSLRFGAYFLNHPEYYWEAFVEFDPQRDSKPKTPAKNEAWQIGIVQNVIFQKIFVRYQSLDPIQITWDKPVVDAVDPDNLPFYAQPHVVKVVISLPDGFPKDQEITLTFQPVQSLFYGPKGIGYLLDPYPDKPAPLAFSPLDSSSPVKLCFNDSPSIGIPFRRGGRELAQAEHLAVFQFWVIARSPSKESFVLAGSPPFTLVTWARFLPSGMKALPPALQKWGSYSAVGAIHNVQYLTDSPSNKSLQPRPGSVFGKPVLTGQTANVRGRQWMSSVGFIPREGTSK